MMTRSSNFQIFPKRNFVKLSFLKFFEIFSLSSKHASVKRFLSLTLKITLIEKYLPITMQPPEVFLEKNRGWPDRRSRDRPCPKFWAEKI